MRTEGVAWAPFLLSLIITDVSDYHITAVYGIFIMNFEDARHLEPKLRTDMVLADKDTGRIISDKERYIYLQLPYFTKSEEE